MKKVSIVAAALLGAAFVFSAGAAEPETVYKGNTDSKTFHKSSCRYFSNTNCTATFSTREAATTAGYGACKVCKP
ncbi:MAG: hypothetical protein WC334_04295 [Kiritimatiellales bacterium]|jgi:methylphosphotriester-DNA--protein-cysteine methyltransferase